MTRIVEGDGFRKQLRWVNRHPNFNRGNYIVLRSSRHLDLWYVYCRRCRYRLATNTVLPLTEISVHESECHRYPLPDGCLIFTNAYTKTLNG